MKLPPNNLSRRSYLWSKAFQSLLSELKYICVQGNLLNPFLISQTLPNILYTCNRIHYSFCSASGISSFHLMSPSSCFRRKSKPLIFLTTDFSQFSYSRLNSANEHNHTKAILHLLSSLLSSFAPSPAESKPLEAGYAGGEEEQHQNYTQLVW